MLADPHELLPMAVEHHRAVAAEVRDVAAAADEMVRDLAERDRARVPRLSRAVLVVDDDEACRWSLVESVHADLGVTVYEAETTRGADAILLRHAPAVIVCDWSLRGVQSGLAWLLGVPRCYRACIVSGHEALAALDKECRVAGVRRFVRPVSEPQRRALTDHVRALLDEATPP